VNLDTLVALGEPYVRPAWRVGSLCLDELGAVAFDPEPVPVQGEELRRPRPGGLTRDYRERIDGQGDGGPHTALRAARGAEHDSGRLFARLEAGLARQRQSDCERQ
jgi:hypothetical protein